MERSGGQSEVEPLVAVPRLGWVEAASPVEKIDQLGTELGLAGLWVKRDDRIEALHGGSKPRKLDYVLATPPWSDAARWVGVGAIGSGQMVALGAAAARVGRALEACLFWTEPTAHTLENLAFTACGPAVVSFYRSRTTLALSRPTALVAERSRGAVVVPPGATCPRGMLGMVRAGLELARQVREGELEEPERLYVAWGSGGTAVGLAMGLSLAGLATRTVGVCVVERAFATDGRAAALVRALREELDRVGVEATKDLALELDRRHVGPGYARSTAEGDAAVSALGRAGIGLEPAYTGKALAALMADARAGFHGRALFWNTARGPLPEPDASWRDRLPAALARRLDRDGVGKPLLGRGEALADARRRRRRVLVLVGAGAVAGAVGLVRTSGYPDLPGWPAAMLAPWEASVLRAAAEVVLPPDLPAQTLEEVVRRIDRYLATMPVRVRREVHALVALVEHGTTPLAGRWHRLTLLAPGERSAFFSSLEARGGMLADAYHGLRDLLLLGYYQLPESWPRIGYEGPRVARDYDPRGPQRMAWPTYDALVAKAGARPRAAM